MKNLFLAAALASASLTPPCIAQQNDTQELDPVIVTATRTSINRDEALVPVIVIDRDQIERSQAFDLTELLRYHAGIEIARSGGPGTVTSVFIRGADSNHTLVLVDGVEINPGTIGGAAVQNIDPSIIERVEIVKGPRSTLYGSNAIGGVINVITRKADGGAELRADVGGGRYGTRQVSANGAYGGRHGEVGFSYTHLETDGFPSRTVSGQDWNVDRGFRNETVTANAATRLGGVEVGARLWQAEGVSEYLGFFMEPLEQAFTNRAATLDLGWHDQGRWQTNLKLSRFTDDIDQRDSTDFVKTERDVLDWQNDLQFGKRHHLVTGITYTDEETRGLSFGAPLNDGGGADGDGNGVDTDFFEIYAADDFDIGRHSFLLAARYTDHDTAGSETTWNTEYGYALGAATRVSASAGTAFRAPDSTDRYGFGGNPMLDAETSLNLELGVRHRLSDSQRLEAHVFQNTIDNLIDYYIIDPATFFGENRNIAEARIRGVEATYELDRDPWRLRVSATLQNPEDRDTGDRLLRRAEHVVTTNFVRRFGRHDLGLDVLISGNRLDFGFPEPVSLSSYVLADLTGTFRVNEHWTLRGRVENLLDDNYETASGFRTAGRGLYLTASYELN